MVINTETGTWINILKVTIREVKACNRLNVKRFNILVNCRAQFFIFPQNLKFLNTFRVFLIIAIRFNPPRFGYFYPTPHKTCKPSFWNPLQFLHVFALFCFPRCCILQFIHDFLTLFLYVLLICSSSTLCQCYPHGFWGVLPQNVFLSTNKTHI